ncbi:MAG: 30S ribosomal protein S15 [Elusimicrobiota bacterium]|nr:30S ribosomal protein S15 [Elusimicrobiota bacterium]
MAFEKKSVIEQFKTHPTDTGSAEIQVALLTTRINHLSQHFGKFPKDFGSKMGFIKLIGQRRRLLDYLKRVNESGYISLIGKLNLRK